MKYKDLHYERTDIDKAKSFMNDVTIKFKNARNSKEQIELIGEVDNFSRDYITYRAIANLNYSRNILDVNFKSEKDFYDSISIVIKEVYYNFNNVIHESKFKDDISKMYGDKFLEEIKIDLKTFDPKIKSLL